MLCQPAVTLNVEQIGELSGKLATLPTT